MLYGEKRKTIGAERFGLRQRLETLLGFPSRWFQYKREYDELLRLDARVLRDIGLSRHEIHRRYESFSGWQWSDGVVRNRREEIGCADQGSVNRLPDGYDDRDDAPAAGSQR